jgi:D-alanyl-D-alanine carboxypeptidase
MARLAIVLLLLSVLAPPSHAHLALIRQGLESDDFVATGDRHGIAVAAGDFDGDGFDDLATGAPHEDNDAEDGDNHGIVVINKGSDFGLTHVDAYSVSIGAVADSEARFGHALASGNFNNDTYDDLAVGVPYLDDGATSDAGAVYVYEGGPNGLDGSPTIYTQSDFGGASETDDKFGWSLAVGDFNDDGIDDLAIGGPGEDTAAGAVFYIYGSDPGGLDTGTAGFFKQGDLAQVANAGERFGRALAAGHVVLDSPDDLVVGAPNDETSGLETGRVTLIPGSAGGLTSVGSTNFNSSEIGFITLNNSLFGWSLAVGRIAHVSGLNGVVDIAIGEPGHQADALLNSGRIIIYQTGALPIPLEQDDVPNTNEVPGLEDWFGWALCAGDLDNNGFDDLFVSAPFKDRPEGAVNVGGVVSRLSYDDGVFPSDSSRTMDGEWLFDEDRDLELGHSIAFGHFDNSGLGAFVFGAPAADYQVWAGLANPVDVDEAGQVTVYAPHRQAFDLRSRSATVHNCEDDVIFSQRMFDRVPTASTAKLLTHWIAVQHIKHAFNGIDSNTVYQVEPWIAECIEGSSADVIGGEKIRLIDIMRMMIAVSGNDAAYCIGDLLTGDSWVWPDPDDCGNKGAQAVWIADSMNTRATELGMTRSFFTNPAGLDTKQVNARPWSTALDMSRLMREGMKEPLFRQIAGTVENEVKGDPYDFEFLKNVRAIVAGATVNGTKPGKTESARRCAVAAGSVMAEDDAISTIFGIDLDAPFGWRKQKAAQLLILAFGTGNCPSNAGLQVLPLPSPDASADVSNIPTAMDTTRVVAPLNPIENSILVEIYRENAVTPDASLNLCVERETEHIIDPGETVTLTVAPFDSLVGIVIVNSMDTPTDLFISHNQPLGTGFALQLASEEDSLVAGPSAFAAPSFTMSVQNLSITKPDTISLRERGYKYDLTLPLNPAPEFTATLSFTGDPLYHNLIARVEGKDTQPGNTVRVIVREPRVVVTGISDDPPGDGGVPGRRHIVGARAYPSPFNPETTIEYELSSPARVSISIYDVGGRLVRELTQRRPSVTGAHRMVWNGRNDAGVQVATGVYFAHVSTAIDVRTVRLVLLK